MSTRTFGHVLAGLDGEEVVAVIREYPPALSGPGGGATLVRLGERDAWPEMTAWLSKHIARLEAAFSTPLARLNQELRS